MSHFADGILKFLVYQEAIKKNLGATLNKKPNDPSGLATAMRTVTVKDIYLSLGLAAVVMTLTSVMGSM